MTGVTGGITRHLNMPLDIDENLEAFSKFTGTPVTTVCVRMLQQSMFGVPPEHADIVRQFKAWRTSRET